MATQFTASDSGSEARAKLNELVSEHNAVAGGIAGIEQALASKASGGSVSAEVQARQDAIEAEAQARTSAIQSIQQQLSQKAGSSAVAQDFEEEASAREEGDAARITYAEAAQEPSRPGELLRLYGSAVDGSSPINATWRKVSPSGSVIAIPGAGVVAPLAAWRLEPYRQYRVRFVVQRSVDTLDPANDAVRLAVTWLNQKKEPLSTAILADLVEIVVANGRVEYGFNLALYDSDNVDVAAPAKTVYFRPFVQTFGSGETFVEVIERTDVTSAFEFSPDLSEYRRQVAGVDFRLNDFITRMEVNEAYIEQSRDAAWFIRGTLDDERLSDRVPFRDTDEAIDGDWRFGASLGILGPLYFGEAEGDGPAARIITDGNYFAIAGTNKAGGFNTLREFFFNPDAASPHWTAEGDLETTGALIVGNAQGSRDSLVVYSKQETDAKDTALQANITAEAQARAAADTTLQQNIDAEATARANGDLAILGGVPVNLNTLNKLAVAIENDPNFATTIRAYADSRIAAQDAMVFKGVIDCSASPHYPTADRGWTYRASTAGKIGGLQGTPVEAGDIILCLTDSTPSGTQGEQGANWAVIQTNIDGALTVSHLGVTVQAYDADLAAIATLTTTAFGRGLLTLPDAAAGRLALELVPGTNVQAYDADLQAIAALAPADNDIIQRKAGVWVKRTLAEFAADLKTQGGYELWAVAPATASSTGIAGQKAYDANFFYVCVAANTWVRAALTTWS